MDKDLCKKCGKCCKNIVVDLEKKILFRDGIETLSDEFLSNLRPKEKRENITICECVFLQDNLCTNQNKPEACKIYPSSPFAFLPEDCEFEGFIFIKNEEIRQKIRKLKEEILDYEAKIAFTMDKSEQNQYRKIIERHQAFIDKYKNYGSHDW